MKTSARMDWTLFAALLPIVGAGLLTMHSFTEADTLFTRQLIWTAVSLLLFFGASFIDWRFLRRSDILFALFAAGATLLLFLFVAGRAVKGAQSWFDFGTFSFQPVEPVKLILVLVLAKYFSRRHIEIARLRHLFISAAYAGLIFALVLLQPDFGGALVVFCIWLCLVLVSGISKRHLAAVFCIGVFVFAGLWSFVFQEYQKARLISFMHPFADIRGSGYNAYQSMIAVGSGGFFGKGVGLGSQSRLNFLPEYETDFIFAAFAEEWGFFGVLILFACFGVVIWRILVAALSGRSNFEALYALGLASFIMSQVFIHIGMNVGLLPVTGITLPFMSYGGTSIATLFLGLGILMGMRRYRRDAHRELLQNEVSLSVPQLGA